MKKYITALLFFVFLISSCSDSSDSGIVLPKKITSHLQNGNVVVYHYSYDGNKLISVTETENDSEQEYLNMQFSYVEDKLTQVNNMMTGEYTEFHYTSDGVLSDVIEYFPAAGYARKLLYNFTPTGYTVGFYQGDLISQSDFLTTEIFTTDGGNMTSHDDGNYLFQFNNDHKNNPFKNISNFSVIQCWFHIGNSNLFGGMYLNQNNVLNAVNGPYVITRTYTYNSADYPVRFYIDDFNTEFKTITY